MITRRPRVSVERFIRSSRDLRLTDGELAAQIAAATAAPRTPEQQRRLSELQFELSFRQDRSKCEVRGDPGGDHCA
jgi:hypothetical protein